MTVIARACPGWIRQTDVDSCWAAVLEAWGRADPQGPQVRQATNMAEINSLQVKLILGPRLGVLS